MVKEYRVDNRKRKKLIQDRIKKHPKWKKKKMGKVWTSSYFNFVVNNYSRSWLVYDRTSL